MALAAMIRNWRGPDNPTPRGASTVRTVPILGAASGPSETTICPSGARKGAASATTVSSRPTARAVTV